MRQIVTPVLSESRRRLKVVISAYACEPSGGSEAAVGWSCAREVSRFHDVWVFTRANNRESIEQELKIHPIANLKFVYFDLPRWMRLWKKGQRGVRLYYYCWQLGAYLVARRLNSRIDFDVMHHVTFVNYWMPSFLSLLRKPFLWGPVGGGESAPYRFWTPLGVRAKLFEIARNLGRALFEIDPFVRITARRATLAIATTEETAQRLQQLKCRKVVTRSQISLSTHELSALSAFMPRTQGRFRLLSVGTLTHVKGFDLGIAAFAQFKANFPDSEYWLIGEGPERRALERLARRLGSDDSVRFWGVLPRECVFERLGECDVLLHPSLHDSGGYVCAEAMAAARPVICLDLGGPALQVTSATGFKIPAISPAQAVTDIAAALNKLATNRFLASQMGRAGRVRVHQHFTAEMNGSFFANLYYQIAAGVQSRQ
jgi:glycosyltransferase involved in cell wall biosynthesis